MDNITKRLRHQVEVYAMQRVENELGEDDIEEVLIKKAYCEIVPLSNLRKTGITEIDTNEHSYKFTFRLKSIAHIKKDWIFRYEDYKYNVIYYNRDFKDNQFVEVYCIRVEE